MTRGEISYRWVSVGSTFVPSYKLTRLINSITTEHVVAGWSGDVIVIQDINKERWLWGFNLKKVGNQKRRESASGHATELVDAQAAAALAAGKVGS